MMQILEPGGAPILYYGLRTERDTLHDCDLLEIAARHPHLEPVMRELQFRRNEMGNEI